MKKNIFIIVTILCILFLGYIKNRVNETSIIEYSNTHEIKEKHKKFLQESPYKETYKLSKKERKAQGLPPNRYFEREWELTMNPELGRPTFENLSEIKKMVNESRNENLVAGRISGDSPDNQWVERGPNNVGGRTRAVMFDPNDTSNETVFAGGVSGGLWKNTNISNADSSWTRVDISDNLNVSTITYDPNKPMTFYLGTGESYTGNHATGNGIWKSTDGGVSWARIFGGISGEITGDLVPGVQHINDLVTRVNGGDTEIYAAVGASRGYNAYIGADSYGLYKSVDDGVSWTKLKLPQTDDGNEYTPNDIAIAADNKVWIGTTRTITTGDGGGKVLASIDANGTVFEDKYTVADGRRVQIVASPTNKDKLYLLAQGTGIIPVIMIKTIGSFKNRFTVSNMALPNDADDGISANDFTRGQAFYNLVIAIDPSDDDNLFVGGIDLFKSINAGRSWSQFSHWYGGFGKQEVHPDQHAIAFAKGDSNKMLFGNDGGVYYSSNGGITTESRNVGYNTSQFYSIGVAPTSSGGENFAGGLQDNGTQAFHNASAGMNSSEETQGGDGAATHYNQDTGNYYIANMYWNDAINQLNLDGSLKKSINSENGFKGDFINQQDLDSNLNILYTNYTDVLTYQIRRYTIPNFGVVQKTILTDPLLQSGGSPTAFKVSPYTTTSTRLYVGTLFGDLLRVDGADGASPVWSDIGTENFVGSISDIEFGASENEIFITIHNYGVKSIWYTNDGGVTWKDKEGDLPDMPIKCILQNPLNTEEVIVGTELGVWYTGNFSNASPNWNSAFNGMSNVKVTDLDMRDDYKVYASTFGRGVFSGVFTAESSLSITDVEKSSNSVVVYPTSSNGNVYVKSVLNYKDTKITVYDINGKLVHKTNLNLFSGIENKLNLTNLSLGMYFVNIEANELNKTVKIIKE